MTMKRVGIIAALHKKGIEQALSGVTELLEGWGVEVRMPPECARVLGRSGGTEDSTTLTRVDLLIALGGDGCVLSAARIAAATSTPVLGIRVGGLGFLSEVDSEHAKIALQKFRDGQYELEKRWLLRAEVQRDGEVNWCALGLNDTVVSRRALSRMVRFQILINCQPVASYPADGVIISTATGSTAYTLSAGGPILTPDVDAFIITPICPHVLPMRSLVVPSSYPVAVSFVPDRISHPEVVVAIDGQVYYLLQPGDVVVVTQAAQQAKLVRLGGQDFFERLRRKLFWGER